MSSDFDAKRDEAALIYAARPEISNLDKALLEREQKEQEEAHLELKRRLKEFRLAQSKEKEDWVYGTLQQVAPLWAVRWAMERGRGWILWFFGVTVDHIGLSRYMEVFEVRKSGKLVAMKLFRWDTGEHLEGGPKSWAGTR